MDSILRREDEAASSAMVRPDGVEVKFRSMGWSGGGGRCEWGNGLDNFF
jgi:hypothetical protein